MRAFLEHWNAHYWPKWRDVLIGNGSEQKIVKRWCMKNREAFADWGKAYSMAGVMNWRIKSRPDDVLPCEEWEARLLKIACWFDWFEELNEWEVASSEKRLTHCLRVAKLARKLANALEETPRPHYPPVLQFFEEGRAADIINCMPEETAKGILSHTKYGDKENPTAIDLALNETIKAIFGKAEKVGASEILSFWMASKGNQQWPSLLQCLADYADMQAKEPRRIARPNTGNPNARAFAIFLSDSFKTTFHSVPNEVIAACVCLKYSDLDSPPNADTIRDWRGVK